MVGNQNSGRDAKFEDPLLVHFKMEREEANKLKILAKKYTNSNRSELILKIVMRFIKSELG